MNCATCGVPLAEDEDGELYEVCDEMINLQLVKIRIVHTADSCRKFADRRAMGRLDPVEPWPTTRDEQPLPVPIRDKRVGVRAWRVTKENLHKVALWVGGRVETGASGEDAVWFEDPDELCCCGEEPQGDAAFPGDWIVETADGKFASWSAVVFEDNYEVLSGSHAMISTPQHESTPATDQAGAGVNENKEM